MTLVDRRALNFLRVGKQVKGVGARAESCEHPARSDRFGNYGAWTEIARNRQRFAAKIPLSVSRNDYRHAARRFDTL
jgi:hypothetical protein